MSTPVARLGSGNVLPPLRLIADDLTGALDSAAQFVQPGTSIPVYLDIKLPEIPPVEFALDSGSRELDRNSAERRATDLASWMRVTGSRLAFRKIDSLLRGNPAQEIAATLRALPEIEHCIIAPAFPQHGRITRTGRQWIMRGNVKQSVSSDLAVQLKQLGIDITLAAPGAEIPPGVSLWDAESELDLQRVAETGLQLPSRSVLWCGSGGLAIALGGGGAATINPLVPPVLGIFGSNHPVTLEQLALSQSPVVKFARREDVESIHDAIGQYGYCLMQFDLEDGISPPRAAQQISEQIEILVHSVQTPNTVLIAGGETLRSLCIALETERLDVLGQVLPGIPVSRLVGGVWPNVTVISKSGAFGESQLIATLLEANVRSYP